MMRRWVSTRTRALQGRKWQPRRYSSFPYQQDIHVPCASSGSITVTLHNLSDHRPTTPLVIWIPPLSYADGYGTPRIMLPRLLDQLPVATINYRWCHPDHHEKTRWPLPIHDILFGYQWTIENLAPPNLSRRDIYVYGSSLGASLAASLALTESHAHEPMAVRGLIAYNGIYNWTTFLPDHPIHKAPRSKSTIPIPIPEPAPQADDDSLSDFRQSMPLLFGDPANIFDPFASPILFFHTSGMNVPADFTTTARSDFTRAVDILSQTPPLSPDTDTSQETIHLKPPRKSHLVFPPRKSTLQIPETLLLHDPPPPFSGHTRRARKSSAVRMNSFRHQAQELAHVMIRSVEMFELKDRMRWDHEFEDPMARVEEAERRVRAVEVPMGGEGGGEGGHWGQLNEEGERVAMEWLRERIGL
ncbi:hypothetical protein QBC47DRAFT_316158 [Echria macrotheca]|uniref:Alpha/beta-hydrolase n=1 Tax=Echria macrotheca TaxID=438768 RepID=A0AAJ0F9Z3_9PEZI|nr:hypothetical protein QBC47DRAFT_316158 [Echria macrotheca]